MPTPTVIFDIDDSLAPSSSCGDNNRQFTFPLHTKKLIETLQSRGVNCLFISNATTSTEIQALLQTVGVQVSMNNIYSSKASHDKNNVLPELTRIVALFRAAGHQALPGGNITGEMVRDHETLQTMAAQFIEKASVAEAWLKVNVPGHQLSEVMLYDDSSRQCAPAIAKGMHTIKADRVVTDSYPAQQPADMPQQFVDIQTWADEISLKQKLDEFFQRVKNDGAENIKNKTMHNMLMLGPVQNQSGLAFLAEVAEAASTVSNIRAFLSAKMPGKSDSTAATLNDIHQAVKKQNWTAAYEKLDGLMQRQLLAVVLPDHFNHAIDEDTGRQIGRLFANRSTATTSASSSANTPAARSAQSSTSSSRKPAVVAGAATVQDDASPMLNKATFLTSQFVNTIEAALENCAEYLRMSDDGQGRIEAAIETFAEAVAAPDADYDALRKTFIDVLAKQGLPVTKVIDIIKLVNTDVIALAKSAYGTQADSVHDDDDVAAPAQESPRSGLGGPGAK